MRDVTACPTNSNAGYPTASRAVACTTRFQRSSTLGNTSSGSSAAVHARLKTAKLLLQPPSTPTQDATNCSGCNTDIILQTHVLMLVKKGCSFIGVPGILVLYPLTTHGLESATTHPQGLSHTTTITTAPHKTNHAPLTTAQAMPMHRKPARATKVFTAVLRVRISLLSLTRQSGPVDGGCGSLRCRCHGSTLARLFRHRYVGTRHTRASVMSISSSSLPIHRGTTNDHQYSVSRRAIELVACCKDDVI